MFVFRRKENMTVHLLKLFQSIRTGKYEKGAFSIASLDA